MRSEKRMRTADIVARLCVIITIYPVGYRSRVPEYKAGDLRERAKKNRRFTGLVSWKSEGDPRIKEFMDSLQSSAENSRTKRYERTSLASLNIGT